MTVVVTNAAAAQLHAIAKQHVVSPGQALERVLDAASSPAALIGGKAGARLRNLRQVFEVSSSGLTADPELVRVVRSTALAEAAVDSRARKVGRRNGGGA